MKTDDQDRRKQRILLTDFCRSFCKEHDKVTGKIMEAMFAGISESDLQTTIRTILSIEENLKGIEENENVSCL